MFRQSVRMHEIIYSPLLPPSYAFFGFLGPIEAELVPLFAALHGPATLPQTKQQDSASALLWIFGDGWRISTLAVW